MNDIDRLTAGSAESTMTTDPMTTSRELRLARRAVAFGPSVWSRLDDLYARHPDPIFFLGGAPAPELIPVDRLREAADRAWHDAPAALDYGEVTGYEPLRRLIAERMAARDMSVAPDQIIVTNGSQQGIDFVIRVVLDPGDEVIVERPTYLGALQSFQASELRFLPVPMDDEGMLVDELARLLEARGRDRAPKLLYTVPTFQNPTGVTLPRARREALIALARDWGILLVEDDPYGELRYRGEPVPPLRALDPGVIHLGTFSKTLAPGLRAGWIAAPPDLAPLLATAKEVTDIHNERITARTVYHAAADFLDQHLATVRPIYARRRETMLAALRRWMPSGVRWSDPAGGFFIWVDLPPGQSAEELLPRAAAAGVLYLPGAWFCPHGEETSALRLNFSTGDEARFDEGIRRLARVIAAR